MSRKADMKICKNQMTGHENKECKSMNYYIISI